MNIKKCNSCGKILTKKDDYFVIDELSFHKGKNSEKSIRLYISDEKKETAYDMKESWCSYTDLDFCPKCFKKLKLDKILLGGYHTKN